MNTKPVQNAAETMRELFERYPCLVTCENEIQQAAKLFVNVFRTGGKLLVCGNGGSAADCEHIVGELMKSFQFKREVDSSFRQTYLEINEEEAPAWLEGALPAISLVSHTALSTAFANDESAVGVFAQQVYGYGRQGDALLAISTSGNSSNVVEAAKVARALGVAVVGLTGFSESALSRISDVCVRVPREKVYQVQELHLPIYHCLCTYIEAEIFGGFFD